MAQWDLTFTYDDVGNRLAMSDAVAGTSTTTTYKTNGLDQITTVVSGGVTRSYTYDPRGNLTGDGQSSYTWDAADRLKTVTGTGYSRAYQYDLLGNMAQETANGVTTRYLWDVLSPYGDILAEINGSGSVTSHYLMGGIDVLAQTQGSTVVNPLRDGQGSTRMVLDATSRAAIANYTYDAFGSLRGSSAPTTPYLYTGQRFDAETNLYNGC